ncbi:MAG: hypothetical protein ABIQ52_16595 [Vicinamibacterales bacterium]
MANAYFFAFVLAVIGSGVVDVEPRAAQAIPRAPTDVKIVRASPGCSIPAPRIGDFHLSVRDGRGIARDYEVIVPSGYTPARTWPIAFVYHGAGQNEAIAKSYGLQDAAGAADSSLFVFPQGMNYSTYGVGWDDSATGYDIIFFDNMLASLTEGYCIDVGRVFVAGFSWGCDQATALICARGDRLRAVSAASCTDEFRNASDYRTYQSCPVQNSAAIRFTHDSSGGDSGYPIPLFSTTSALYRLFNSCSNSSTPTSPSPCVAYASCTKPVVECSYANLGHALPANWAAETWAFFASFK